MHIDTTYPSRDTARAAVVGEVDLATAEDLRDRLLDVLRGHPPVALTVDLSGVTFVDCTGISALVAVRNAVVQVDCHLRVTGVRPIVRRILDLTGLLSVLTVPPDQAQRPVTNPETLTGSGSSATASADPEWLVAA
ncbi:STAS domain-containing protein [Asanoa sp. NPDC049573]|uniref:STAS domain-containing protein n=1 Tax=Asanoa sp. NPDC049573 TaxID=3155396 RepID=UPI00342BE5B2